MTKRTDPTKWLPVAAICLLVLAGLLTYVYRNEAGPSAKLSGKTYHLDIADTEAEREQGLSGRDHLEKNQAMLFVFQEPGKHCFWMKDMRFNLDILWLDNNHHLIAMQENVTPGSYPNSYCPNQPASYVLEINAGEAKQLNLHLGDRIRLEKL